MNKDKIILDLCGGTGAWSKPYKDAGYDVRLITLPDYDVSTYEPPENVYGILASPPCTMFSFARCHPKSSLRDLKSGCELVWACMDIVWKTQYNVKSNGQRLTTLKFWALENPNGFLKYFLGKPAFRFDPWHFWDMYTKETFLWGWFNEPIKTCEFRSGLKSISAYIWKDVKTRQSLRSITPAGFAQAFYRANS